MPPGLHENNTRARFQSWPDVAPVPFPDALADGLTIGVITTSDRVINNNEITSKASDTNSGSCSEIFAPGHGCPPSGCGAIPRKLDAEHCGQIWIGDNVSDFSAKAFSQFDCM
jgi:hypothetical protein